jgi:xanthine dehydrogenase accessory factor
LGGANCIVGEIEQELARFPIDRHTYIVIVTRGHKHDGRALLAVVNSPAKYVGLIGSKRKVLTIFEDLQKQGVSREALSKIHAPIGLEIGAATPMEIAVSIMAELIAVRRGRGGQAVGPMKISADKFDSWLKD